MAIAYCLALTSSRSKVSLLVETKFSDIAYASKKSPTVGDERNEGIGNMIKLVRSRVPGTCDSKPTNGPISSYV